MAQVQSQSQIPQSILEHIRFLKQYYLSDRVPIPVNSKLILNRLMELLDYCNTNSFYYADPVTKTVALADVLILLSHASDFPAVTGMVMNDPKSIEVMEPEESTLRVLVEFVKKALRDVEVV